jgi:hypothetical protein
VLQLRGTVETLTAVSKEAEAARNEVEVLRQRHAAKHKEQLERNQAERARIAEEMRSACTELTQRQAKLTAARRLVSLIDAQAPRPPSHLLPSRARAHWRACTGRWLHLRPDGSKQHTRSRQSCAN